MEDVKYTLSGESITVVWKGKAHTIRKGAPNFVGLRDAVLKAVVSDDWSEVPGFFTVALSIENWAKGRFKVNPGSDTIYYDDRPLPHELNDRIMKMVARGEDPAPFFNFWERLQRNPSMRSVDSLYKFLVNQGIAFTPEGRFLAYKGLKADYKDCHTGKVDNRPGTINKMPRNLVSDDPRTECHYGYHVGSESYARGFAQGQVVICEVDPEHVVCVPYADAGKLRCCEYKVVGNYGSTLSSTVHVVDEHDPDEDDEDKTVDLDETDEFEDEDEDLDDEDEEDEEDEETDNPDDALDDKNWEEDGKTPKKSRTPPFANSVPEKTPVKMPKGYAKLNKLDFSGLMQISIDELRQYAGKGLKILGASKIPGGKTALVTRIVQVRDEEVKDG